MAIFFMRTTENQQGYLTEVHMSYTATFKVQMVKTAEKNVEIEMLGEAFKLAVKSTTRILRSVRHIPEI